MPADHLAIIQSNWPAGIDAKTGRFCPDTGWPRDPYGPRDYARSIPINSGLGAI